MLKLGLIGTVIGFIIMLGSLSDITTFRCYIASRRSYYYGKWNGCCTLHNSISFVAGVMVAIQYFNLESGCEELIFSFNQISEVSIDNSL